MVKVPLEQIKTTEVLEWKGIHLLHALESTCSQKIRITLALKKLKYEGRIINILQQENRTPWFLGINPRALIPVLIDDGEVHIESNDIMEYLEQKHPEPSLLPQTDEEKDKVQKYMDMEDEMHLHMRVINFRFGFPPPKILPFAETQKEKVQESIDQAPDEPDGKGQTRKDHLAFWTKIIDSKGISDDLLVEAFNAYDGCFKKLDEEYGSNDYLVGDRITLADIAWFIAYSRFNHAGFPFELYPNAQKAFEKMGQLPGFKEEKSVGATGISWWLRTGTILFHGGNMRTVLKKLKAIE